MILVLSTAAERDMDCMDQSVRRQFTAHFDKVQHMPPRRHLRLGIPFNVENVTSNSRFVYAIDGETLTVLRCFATHKEYERWYKSFG